MEESLQPKPKAAESAGTPDRPAHIALVRFSSVEFLFTLIVFFVVLPFVDNMPYGRMVDSILMTLVLASAVLAVGRRPKIMFWAVVLVLPAVVGRWVQHYHQELISPSVFPAAGLLFVSFIVGQFLHFILKSPRVNSEVLCAGISTYLLFGLLWMFAYLLVNDLSPGSFAFNSGEPATHSMNGFNAYYFSFVTLSTVGYGDITPVSSGARALAVMESLTGTLYVAVLVARLVALYSTQSTRSHGDGGH